MLKDITIQAVFLIVIGVTVFVSGTSGVNRQKKLKKEGFLKDAKVVLSTLVEKKDNDGFLIQHYYDITLKLKVNGEKIQKKIKNVNEYIKGENLKVYFDMDRGGELHIYDSKDDKIFNPWLLIAIGILIILLPFIQNKKGIEDASLVVAAIFFLMGASFIHRFLKDRKKKIEKIEAEIVGVIKWQGSSSRIRKKITNTKSSYYPILKYNIDGKEREIRSKFNSDRMDAYKIGGNKILFRDLDSNEIFEKISGKNLMFFGVLFSVLGLIGIISIII